MRPMFRRLNKLSRLVRNPVYRRGLRSGVGAAIEHEAALRSIRFATLLDVGANVGQFSLLAKSIVPSVQVHAFEPLSAMADRYDQLFHGDVSVKLYRVAAGDTAGKTQINVSGRPDSSSILNITKTQNDIFPGTASVSTEEIQIIRVDDAVVGQKLVQPVLVKLDVQGYELSALKGMPDLLKIADYIYVELSFIELYEGQPLADEIIAWLSRNAFRLAGVYNLSTDQAGVSVQADVLFTRCRTRAPVETCST